MLDHAVVHHAMIHHVVGAGERHRGDGHGGHSGGQKRGLQHFVSSLILSRAVVRGAYDRREPAALWQPQLELAMNGQLCRSG
jgi:hypothetical protein